MVEFMTLFLYSYSEVIGVSATPKALSPHTYHAYQSTVFKAVSSVIALKETITSKQGSSRCYH